MKPYFIILFLWPLWGFAQHIYISPEFSKIAMKSDNIPVLENSTQVYNFKIGIDYLEKEHYFISSNVGFRQKGGNEKNPLIIGDWNNITRKWEYITIGSSYNYKFNLDQAFVYIGIGPEINFLITKDPLKNTPYEDDYQINKTILSANSQLGFIKIFGKFRFGVYTYYQHSFSEIGKSNFNKLRNNGLNFGISFGYQLDRF